MTHQEEKKDKRKKAHPEDVDISNGALFLRVVALEREIKGLKQRLNEMEPRIGHAYLHTMRIGGE